MDDRPITLGTLPDGRRLHLGDAAGRWPASGGVLLIRGHGPVATGKTYLDEIISQFCRTSATHVIDLVGRDYGWMLEGMRTLSRSMGEACMTVGEIRAGMHEDPRGTTVIINGAEFLCSDAHEYSSLLAHKLTELIASRPRGGVTVVLAGGDFDMTKLLVTGVDGGYRIEFGSRDQVKAAQYLLGDLQGAVIPAGAAIYESPFGSLSTFFSPRVGSDGRSVGDAFLELPLGIEGANFSTTWAQNLVVCGGSRIDRSQVIAAMAMAAQESGTPIWVATSAPDSAFSADWRHHRGSMATGVVQAGELLRLVCDRVFPRIDACRALNTTDVRDRRIPADLAMPLLIFVDDLDAMMTDSANRPELVEAAEAVDTLIDFIAKTASQTNVTLVVGTAVSGLAEFGGHESLWNSAAQLQLDLPAPDAIVGGAPLYFAAPGLPAVPLEAARVQ